MSRSRLRPSSVTAALGLTIVLLLAACSGEAPETEGVDAPQASPTAPDTANPGQDGGTAGDGEEPATESATDAEPAPLSAGEEQPEGTEVVTEDAFSLAVPAGWEQMGASGPQGEYHYTDPDSESRGVAVLLSAQPGDRVEAALPLAEDDLLGAGLDPQIHRVEWPGADAAALVVYDDPEAAPPAVVRTYQLFLDAPDGTAVWVLGYDDVETVEESPVTAMLASFRLQES